MKTRSLFLALTVLYVVVKAQAQTCGDINSRYHRNIPADTWSWGFDNNTLGARYQDGTLVSPAQIRDFIRNAVGQWTAAANAAGTRITMTETSYESAQLKVQFALMGPFSCGEASSSSAMNLNA